MAIRAAAAAGVNITYKILYNDAVAMTGGQPVEGAMTVPQIAQQVLAEGARRVVVVTDEPDKYPKHAGFPAGVAIRHRDDLDAVQRELRDIPGLTVLIYDQTCAAEKRRRRKRGTFPDPPERVFINDAVCEGCGDCSDKSNCISVLPLETELGRKRRIDQSNCNKDFSCLKGFCPSFVTVRGGTPRKLGGLAANDSLFADLPEPKRRRSQRPYGILVTGVGGTGVVTVGALIGMAAHLEGKGCTVLDITGLAQKNGAVMSHVRLAPQPEDLHAVRVASGGADVLLACDLVVAASPAALSRLQAGVTKAIINSHAQPTAAFIFKPDIDFETAKMLQAIKTAAGDERRQHRRHRARRGADGRFHRRQSVHARLRVPERSFAAHACGHRARHRTERRRGRRQQAQLSPGAASPRMIVPKSRRWCAARCATMQRPNRRGSTPWSNTAPRFLKVTRTPLTRSAIATRCGRFASPKQSSPAAFPAWPRRWRATCSR